MMCTRSIIEDDNLTGADAWCILARFINADELLDETALAARESDHAKAAYAILRELSSDTIPTLQARIFQIEARNARP
jgi:hypothetical protein